MSPLAKVFVLVNFVLSVAFFGSSATLFATRTNWREEALRYKKDSENELERVRESFKKQGGRLVDLAKNYEKLMVNYNTVSAEKIKLETTLTEARGELAKAHNRIDTEVKRGTQLDSRVQDLDKKNGDLLQRRDQALKEAGDAKAQMEVATNEMQRSRLDLHKANERHSKTLIALNELTEKAQTMEFQLQALAKAGVDVDLIGSPPPIDAVIQAVNKEGLVVLSVGREQKVQEGYEFTVYRGDHFVGKVKVIKVYDELAGARVLYTASDNDVIQVGDKAATQL